MENVHLLVSLFASLFLASPACECAAQETELANRFNSLSELQWGAGIIEQTDKQTWLPEVWEPRGRRAQPSGLLKKNVILLR